MDNEMGLHQLRLILIVALDVDKRHATDDERSILNIAAW